MGAVDPAGRVTEIGHRLLANSSSELLDVAVEGTALGLVIAFVARPISTFVATVFGGYSWREQVVLGWAGLRGALPVVFATFPVIEGVPHSLDFFNIAFFAVVVSTLIQGATFEPLAKWLGAELLSGA